jgi:hypothetical protein
MQAWWKAVDMCRVKLRMSSVEGGGVHSDDCGCGPNEADRQTPPVLSLSSTVCVQRPPSLAAAGSNGTGKRQIRSGAEVVDTVCGTGGQRVERVSRCRGGGERAGWGVSDARACAQSQGVLAPGVQLTAPSRRGRRCFKRGDAMSRDVNPACVFRLFLCSSSEAAPHVQATTFWRSAY